jgi:hypothetical protein
MVKKCNVTLKKLKIYQFSSTYINSSFFSSTSPAHYRRFFPLNFFRVDVFFIKRHFVLVSAFYSRRHFQSTFFYFSTFCPSWCLLRSTFFQSTFFTFRHFVPVDVFYLRPFVSVGVFSVRRVFSSTFCTIWCFFFRRFFRRRFFYLRRFLLRRFVGESLMKIKWTNNGMSDSFTDLCI